MKNKCVLVLGGSSDIGIELIRKYLSQNWKVICHYNKSETGLNKLGKYHSISEIIKNEKIEEVIIATEPKEHEKINSIINDLADLKVEIKVVADMYSILTGSVKMNSIFGALLISVNPEMMPSWQKTVKRIMDLLISIIAIILLSPIFIILSVLIK